LKRHSAGGGEYGKKAMQCHELEFKRKKETVKRKKCALDGLLKGRAVNINEFDRADLFSGIFPASQ
jgi:hypothetical protein